MIITISGIPGSGKSTVAEILARKLGYKFYSIGGMRRKMALERGMTLEEFNKLGEKEDFTDKQVDEYQKELGEKEDNLVMEGRTSYYFIPKSIKIFIDADLKKGAERIWNDLQIGRKRNEANYKSFEETFEGVKNRMNSDILRYKKYYGIENCYDKKSFDFITDSTDKEAEQVADEIYTFIKKYKIKKKKQVH